MTGGGYRAAASVDRPERHRPGASAAGQSRLFVAVPVPEVVAARVGEVVDAVSQGLGPNGHGVRWVQMEGLHLTLRFLGPTPADRIEVAAAATAQSARAVDGSFEVRLGGAGAFPDAARPRALWLGIREGGTELGHLADALASALAAAGWELEERRFRPHLTIARVDGVRAGVEAGHRLVAAAAELDLAFVADRVVLYRSHLGRGPARYEPLRTAALG